MDTAAMVNLICCKPNGTLLVKQQTRPYAHTTFIQARNTRARNILVVDGLGQVVAETKESLGEAVQHQ